MIDTRSGSIERTGTGGGPARARGLDLERAWLLRSVLRDVSAPSRKQDKMPNGDPPNLILWGAEESE